MQLDDGGPPRALDVSEDLLLADLVRRQQPTNSARAKDHHAHRVGDCVVQLAGDAGAFVDDRGVGQQLLLLLETLGERGDLDGLVVLATDGQPEDEEDGRRHTLAIPDKGPSPGSRSCAVTPQISAAAPPTTSARRRGRCAATAVTPRTAPRSGRSARSARHGLPVREGEEEPGQADDGQSGPHQHQRGSGDDPRPPEVAAELESELRAQHAAGPGDQHRDAERQVSQRDAGDASRGRGFGTSGHQCRSPASPWPDVSRQGRGCTSSPGGCSDRSEYPERSRTLALPGGFGTSLPALASRRQPTGGTRGVQMTQVQTTLGRRLRVQSLAPAAFVAAAGFLVLTVLGFTLGFADIPAMNWTFLVTLVATTLALAATSQRASHRVVPPCSPSSATARSRSVSSSASCSARPGLVLPDRRPGQPPRRDRHGLDRHPRDRQPGLAPWTGVLFILAGLFSVLFAELGTSLLAVALWSVVGRRLTRENRTPSQSAL